MDVQINSVSKRVGTARIFGVKRIVEEPKRSVKPPTCFLPIKISGRRPFHLMSTRIFPEGSFIVVRLCTSGAAVEDGFCCFEESEAKDDDDPDVELESRGVSSSTNSEGGRVAVTIS